MTQHQIEREAAVANALTGGGERGPFCCTWPLLRALVAASNGLAEVIDLEGTIRLSSPAHARLLLGVPASEAVGRSVRDFFAPALCDFGLARARRIVESGRPVREIAMLRGMHVTTTLVPLEVPGEGSMVLLQTTPTDPVRRTLMEAHAERVEAVEHPIADLGPLERLTRPELQVARALAAGLEVSDIADGVELRPADLARAIDRMAYAMGWRDERGLRTHAYALGLHLYDESYFQSVVLEAAREE